MRIEVDVLLKDRADGSRRAARLIYGLTLDEVDEATALWSVEQSKLSGIASANPQHTHWNWSFKARAVLGLVNYSLAGIMVQGEMQGMALWDDLLTKARHPSQLGKDCVYLSFLATAPWNDRSFTTTPRFGGVGSTLVLTAVERSIELEYRGRLGLHALPQAEPFYHRCGFIDMGPDTMHDSLRYFEFTPSQAQAFQLKIGA